jgi:ABC-type multidrug transport system fused ATPase/permease subunit
MVVPVTPPSGRVLRRGLRMVRTQVRMEPRAFSAGMGCAAVFAVATVGQSWALGRAVDRAVLPTFVDGRPRWGAALAALVLLVGVGMAKSAAVVGRRTSVTYARSGVEVRLRRRILGHYQALPMAWHRRHSTGELLAHAEADVVNAVDILNPLPYASGVGLLVVLTAGWLVATDPVLGLVAVVMFPSVILLSQSLNQRVEHHYTEAQRRAGRVSSVAAESFDGAAVVKAVGAEDREAARFTTEANALRDARATAARTRAVYDAVLDALPNLGMVALVGLGTWRIRQGALTTGQLVAFVNLFALLAFPLRLIAFVLEDLPRSLAGWDRVRGVLAEPLPPQPPHVTPLPDGPLDLTLDHVSLTFDDGAVAPALHDVSLHVPAGSTLALVGTTGSGKSTLLLLLGRLLAPTEGRVLVGGVDLAMVEDGELAAAVATAFQEPFLFGRSVAGNIGLGRTGGLEREELTQAASLAQADEFVRRLPDGYDTVVGERGATLSGGQRQRVALARALVSAPRVLLLDDATSSVDPATEGRILSGLHERLVDTTTVVVATRISTIGLADQVAYLDRSRLVATGTHGHLLATQPGYRAVVEAYR